jgi:hypothetical protein
MLDLVTSIFTSDTQTLLIHRIKELNMWNAKRTNLFLAICFTCGIAICLMLIQSCTKEKPPKKFEVVLAGNYFVPSADETVAIVLHRWSSGKEDYNTPLALIGYKEQTEKIMGRSFEPEKLFEDRNLLKKIVDAYRNALKEAEENHFERNSNDSLARILFVTTTKGYIRIIGVDEDTVHDNYMESESLKKYFDELNLTDELCRRFELVGARNYHLPPTDKVVAILFYPYIRYGCNYPAALFGDKKLTEQLMAEELKGKPLEPKRIIEGRDWLVRIMNTYNNALKEAEEKKFLNRGGTNGKTIFVTSKNGYIKAIGVDANTVYDKYMESKLLKKYFDELGITDEMGRSGFDIDSLGLYRTLNKGEYVPPIDETTAILLYPLDNCNLYTPLALIGDKKITEKIMGISFEPKKLIEGRDWLAKIMDTYKNAQKQVDEKKSYLESCRVDTRWQIIFVTEKKGYYDLIGVDANTVYDLYMESELLKAYFDELGLTKELLAAEPNTVRHPKADKAVQN